MPITMELRENERVIYYRATNPVNLDYVIAMFGENQVIRDQHPYTIHTIINLAQASWLPSEMLGVRRNSPDIKHPRAGSVLVVGASSFVRSVVEIIINLADAKNFRFFATEDEAWATIREIIANEPHQND